MMRNDDQGISVALASAAMPAVDAAEAGMFSIDDDGG
jgi:hypothetical protein